MYDLVQTLKTLHFDLMLIKQNMFPKNKQTNKYVLFFLQ